MPGKRNAAVLLKKARDDQRLLHAMLDDGLGTDEQVGFFCQQAVEKAIKAVLEHCEIPYRFTHELAELIDAVIDNGVDHPGELEQAVELTPFAAGLRYADLPTHATGEDDFDAASAARVVDRAVDWAESVVEGA